MSRFFFAATFLSAVSMMIGNFIAISLFHLTFDDIQSGNSEGFLPEGLSIHPDKFGVIIDEDGNEIKFNKKGATNIDSNMVMSPKSDPQIDSNRVLSPKSDSQIDSNRLMSPKGVTKIDSNQVMSPKSAPKGDGDGAFVLIVLLSRKSSIHQKKVLKKVCDGLELGITPINPTLIKISGGFPFKFVLIEQLYYNRCFIEILFYGVEVF